MCDENAPTSLLEHFNSRNTIFIAQTSNVTNADNTSTSSRSRSPRQKPRKSLTKSYSNSSLRKSLQQVLDPLVDKVLDNMGLLKDTAKNKSLYSVNAKIGSQFDSVYDETCR